MEMRAVFAKKCYGSGVAGAERNDMNEKKTGRRRLGHSEGRGLIPGAWNDNPVTCRILRNAGFELPGMPKKDDPVRM